MATQGAGSAGAIGYRSACLARAALLALAFGLGVLPLTAASLTLQTAKSFKPSAINSGGRSILTISLLNNDVANDATQVGFTDAFPAGMTLDIGTPSNTCGGTLSTQQGSITLINGFVGADGGTCQVSVPVTATSTTDATLTNVTSSFSCFAALAACNGKAASADLFVTGAGTAPAITSGAPPPGTVGIPYAFQVTATGTPTPSVSASGLPAGLSFSAATNQINGTPTTAGTFATTVVASNGVPPDATQTYSVVIIPPLTIIIPGGNPALPGGTTGQPYGPATFTGSGGTPPYTWGACNRPPPPGLALSAGGTLSGTPTQAGTFTFDVCITDSTGGKTSQTVTVVIAQVSSKLSVTVAPDPAASGIPVVVTAKVTGGSIAATGLVQVWVAGTGTKCPLKFEAGKPADPDAAMRTATLDASGQAQLTYIDPQIDDYLVCVQYVGDALYQPASAGPVDLSVIKGFLLPPPSSPSAVVEVSGPLLAGAGNAVIPTLQQWAVGVLALIVAMLGLRRLRRRSL